MLVVLREVEATVGKRTLDPELAVDEEAEEEEEGTTGATPFTLLDEGMRLAGSTAGNTSPPLAIAISFMA